MELLTRKKASKPCNKTDKHFQLNFSAKTPLYPNELKCNIEETEAIHFLILFLQQNFGVDPKNKINS